VTDEETCTDCDGSGHFPCEECTDGTQETVLPGVLAGVVVNRTLLAKALASAPPDGTVMLAVTLTWVTDLTNAVDDPA
jgi:DnaJ-class molecular chaperone